MDIAKWRSDLGLTAAKSASALGVSYSQIFRYQNEQCPIPESILKLMAAITYCHKHGIEIPGLWPIKTS